MKKLTLTGLVILLLTGCASQQLELQSNETAVVDYLVIQPLPHAEGKTVCKLQGSFEQRHYVVNANAGYLNTLVKKLLLVKENVLSVESGVLVIHNTAGAKLRIGGSAVDLEVGTVEAIPNDTYIGEKN